MEYNVSASDILDLADAVLSNIKAETLEDAISFADSVRPNFVFLNISDSLVFHELFGTGGLRTLTIADTLTFTDATAPRVLVASINDFLFLWDVADTPVDGSIVDTFVLTDAAVGVSSYLVNPDTFTFTDSLGLLFLPNKILEETLTLSDRCSCVAVNRLAPYLPQA